MMEKEKEEGCWHLIRNNNGEWISDEHAVFPDKLMMYSYMRKAALWDKKLTKQQGADGRIWFYKYEMEEIDKLNDEKQSGGLKNLKITKKISI